MNKHDYNVNKKKIVNNVCNNMYLQNVQIYKRWNAWKTGIESKRAGIDTFVSFDYRYLKKKKKRKERNDFAYSVLLHAFFFFNDTLYAFNSIISYRFVSLWIDCHVRTCTPNVCVNKSIKLVYNFLHGDIIKSKVYNMINWTSVYQETNLSSVLLVLLLVTTYLTSIDNF